MEARNGAGRFIIFMNFDESFDIEQVIGFDVLYASMNRCKKGVGWKDSTAHFCLNGIEEVLRLEKQLKDGAYKPRPQRAVKITHPKPRDAVSIAFRDRVYQRSLNDVAIYPAMTNSFILDNAACQKGKGTDFARNRLDEFLRKYYRKHGTEGWVLQCDIHGYYKNMAHASAEACFRRYLQPEVYDMAVEVLHHQYKGDTGYNPGSQMVQIAGISTLSPLDHYIKEQLRVEFYLRYMDDFIHAHESRTFLERCRDAEAEELEKIGLELHPEKTRIYPIREGIPFLGFRHKLTKTGKVLRLIDPKNVKAERQHLRHMVAMAKRGEITRRKVDVCFNGWIAHAKKGNTEQVVQKMTAYYKELWKGDLNNGILQQPEPGRG